MYFTIKYQLTLIGGLKKKLTRFGNQKVHAVHVDDITMSPTKSLVVTKHIYFENTSFGVRNI